MRSFVTIVPQDDKEKVNMMIRNGKQNHVTGVILRRSRRISFFYVLVEGSLERMLFTFGVILTSERSERGRISPFFLPLKKEKGVKAILRRFTPQDDKEKNVILTSERSERGRISNSRG